MSSQEKNTESADTQGFKGWHSRGYLPHCDALGVLQFVTFRLYDSLPEKIIARWKEELEIISSQRLKSELTAVLRERTEECEDAGHGACLLKNREIAAMVQNALLRFDGERYRLLEWCIMPNHVHVLLETIEQYPLLSIVHSWKSFTAHKANLLLERKGNFWAHDYYDRFIRDDRHLAAVRDYIRENPVKCGLAVCAADYEWGSAWMGWG
jgi:REP element-mobilizing transposase RayT